MPQFKIDIISDVVCPWCYIGYRRLSKAITTFRKSHPAGPSSTFSLKWHAFYLNPAAPTPGIPVRERMEVVYGGVEGRKQKEKVLNAIGMREGIKFNFESRNGRTRDAHRLVEVAGQLDDKHSSSATSSGPSVSAATAGAGGEQETLEERVVKGLYGGYFEGGNDITDKKWIEGVGKEAGLDDATLREWRDEDGGGKDVDADAAKSRRFTSGVPQFTINGKYVVEGAQDPDEFFSLFAEIAKAEETHEPVSNGGAIKGDSC